MMRLISSKYNKKSIERPGKEMRELLWEVHESTRNFVPFWAKAGQESESPRAIP